MRTRVYVDGFNLYYRALKGTPFKWLNPVELARQALPVGYVVDKLLYFTARVSGVSDPGVASHVRHIRRAMLKAAQFPDALPSAAISKPAGW